MGVYSESNTFIILSYSVPGIEQYIDLPSEFFSDASGIPFQHCLGCDLYLLDDETRYFIEKARRRYPGFAFEDTVFEYAMCIDCLAKLHNVMSEDSLQRVQAYFAQRVDLETRSYALLQQEPCALEPWISSCIVKGTDVKDMTEYQIYGLFEGNRLVFNLLPYAIGGEAIDEVSELLSNKTLGEIDGFMDEYFGLPPELRKPVLAF